MWVKAMPLFKRCATVSKAYNISKELGDKAAAYLAIFNVTEKKFRNTVFTLSRTR